MLNLMEMFLWTRFEKGNTVKLTKSISGLMSGILGLEHEKIYLVEKVELIPPEQTEVLEAVGNDRFVFIEGRKFSGALFRGVPLFQPPYTASMLATVGGKKFSNGLRI